MALLVDSGLFLVAMSEPDETIDVTIKREVLETGVSAMTGLIGVRSRVFTEENSIYLVFLLRAATETWPGEKKSWKHIFFPPEEAPCAPDLRAHDPPHRRQSRKR